MLASMPARDGFDAGGVAEHRPGVAAAQRPLRTDDLGPVAGGSGGV